MAFDFIITTDAEEDLQDIVGYYLNAGRPIASHFAEAFDHTIDLICEYPQVGTIARNNIRRRLISGYPYSVYYKVSDNHELQILAILHFRRNPKLLIERLEN